MAISFPLELDDFFDDLGIVTAQMDINDPRTSMQTRGGATITMNLGAFLWSGSVSISPNYGVSSSDLEARAATLRQAGASFYVTDARRGWPAYDPDGSILGVSTPVLSGIDSGNLEIDISGLPEGYEIRRGDLLSFEVSGVKHLHRATGTQAANSSGQILSLDVFPRVSQNAVTGAAITLGSASCKAILDVGGFSGSTHRPLISDGFSFSWTQTLK